MKFEFVIRWIGFELMWEWLLVEYGVSQEMADAIGAKFV